MNLYYRDMLSPRKACVVARRLGSPVDFVYLETQSAIPSQSPWTGSALETTT